MKDISINLDHVTLRVPTYEQRERSASSIYASFIASAFDPPVRTYRTLLDDISLSLKAGDRVAILGKNGAGKSTLLRVLAGAYNPSEGAISIEGRMQALLNISLGLLQDATVKENIYLRGAAMGLSIRECHDIIPAVLEFSGLQDRAGDRLRVLSTGQKMRLAFSVTTEIHSDILLMDEWIGTGDAEFFAKAQARLRGRVDSAKIVVLASHSIPVLRQICNRAIYLDSGRLLAEGPLDEIVKRYIPQAAPPPKPPAPPPAGAPARPATTPAKAPATPTKPAPVPAKSAATSVSPVAAAAGPTPAAENSAPIPAKPGPAPAKPAAPAKPPPSSASPGAAPPKPSSPASPPAAAPKPIAPANPSAVPPKPAVANPPVPNSAPVAGTAGASGVPDDSGASDAPLARAKPNS